ncbi:GNAT family N-acetyltransferase [Pontibacillus salicampi]|uniref:GNAT family N-acetyltransferase n=1 Tax=Pontibacillus salicampi TaxID=1449801 RepID=A0ABV6LT08_9BACI
MEMKTARLQLREMTGEDVDHLLEIFADPIAMQYYPSTKNREQTKQWIEWNKRLYKQEGIGLWIVEDRKTSCFVGQCGLVPQEIQGEKRLEIGYLLSREQWGNGFATEAAQACRDYAFHVLEVAEVISIIDIRNTPSINVAKRIGMKKEQQLHIDNKQQFIFRIGAE